MRRASLLLLLLLSAASLAAAAGAQEMLPATRTTAGIQYVSISTHFAKYYPSTVDAWETFSTRGLSANRMWRFKESETYSLYRGAGYRRTTVPERVDRPDQLQDRSTPGSRKGARSAAGGRSPG